jgi:60kDa lysophospholipase
MLHSVDESRVLVIYTGGTIGMLPGPGGYVPEPFFLTEILRSQKRFHDPFGDSLFSNLRSVEGFREWSGRATPVDSPSMTTTTIPISPDSSGHNTPTLVMTADGIPTMLVRSTRPLTVSTQSSLTPSGTTKSEEDLSPACKKIHDRCYEIHLPSLVTPASTTPNGGLKRIRYAVLEVSKAGRLMVIY